MKELTVEQKASELDTLEYLVHEVSKSVKWIMYINKRMKHTLDECEKKIEK